MLCVSALEVCDVLFIAPEHVRSTADPFQIVGGKRLVRVGLAEQLEGTLPGFIPARLTTPFEVRTRGHEGSLQRTRGAKIAHHAATFGVD